MNDYKHLNRLELVKNQLLSNQEKGPLIFKSRKNNFSKWKKKSSIDKEIIENLYYPVHNDIRHAVNKIMISNPEFQHFSKHDMSMDSIRELTVKQMKILVRELNKTISFKDLRADTKKFFVFLDTILAFDSGLSVKFGVHSVLYYNCLKKLSTVNHQSYIERCVNFEDIGCFGLTELGHGSNVRDIKTTATYDEQHKEFVLNSTSYEAYKWWIGGAAKSANMSCIFAQLYVKGICHGVHAFLVPLRDIKSNLPFPGVILGDCGPKVGNENIDNGFISFNNYRIPREALLDKISQVSEDGVFSSTIPNPDTRFATALGALEEGRVTIGAGSVLLLRNALCIAGRYAALRKQFGREENEEYSIFNYPTTQVRLIPALAENLAFRITSHELINRWMDVEPFLSDPKNDKIVEFHALLSIFKPLATWATQDNLQPMREVMGGHGYSRLNMIGSLRNNNDINVTWEGDNTVLLQQTARFITKGVEKKMKGKNVNFKTLSFLSKFDDVLNEKLNISDRKDLKNLDNLVAMFEHKINLLLLKSVTKLSEKIADNMGSFDAWNHTQVFYLQKLTKTFGHLYLFNCFRSYIVALVDSPTKSVLFDLLVLYSLSTLEKELDLLRENDFILSDVCDMIRNEILSLCENLKKDFIPIIDAISPPDEILGASLGSSSGYIFENYLNDVFSSKGCFERAQWWEIIHHKKI